MDTAVKTRRLEQHQGERPNALGRLTGEPPATPSQGSLLAAAAELVAALEAFDVGGDRSGEVGRKDESLNSGRQVVTGAFQKPRARGPESAAAGRKASGTVPGLTGNEWAAEALEVGQHPRTSTDLTPSPAWRDFFAQFRTPHAPYLVITAKDQACLYDFFKGTFAGVETVEVRMDRRSGERRPPAERWAVINGRQRETGHRGSAAAHALGGANQASSRVAPDLFQRTRAAEGGGRQVQRTDERARARESGASAESR